MSSDDELGALIRAHATRHRASAPLQAAVRTQLALQAAATGQPGVGAGWRLQGQSWRSAAWGLVCGVVLTLALAPLWLTLWPVPAGSATQQQQQRALEVELLALHVQAMGKGPLIQVASSDRHTVKPWFQGRIDFAPPVPDLAAAGFPLLGGRVDPLQGQRAAALVYARDRHYIGVTLTPDAGPPAAGPQTRSTAQASEHRGFHFLHWREGGMRVWVVSDVEASELLRFAAAWRGALPVR
jgi:anti-sigma factor RsiW